MGRACARLLGGTMDLVLTDASPSLNDFANELMADHHRRTNGASCPFVPFIDVDVRPADARAANTNQDVIDAHRGVGDVREPEAFLRARFNEGLHRNIVLKFEIGRIPHRKPEIGKLKLDRPI